MPELSPQSTAAEVLAHLRSIGSEENRKGMLRYGIKIDRALGISHDVQRDIAKKIKKNHERSFELWASGIMEAQFIAAVTADPKRFTAQNARDWASEFNSWDIVDGVSGGEEGGTFRRHRSMARADRRVRGGRARIRAPYSIRNDGMVGRAPKEGARCYEKYSKSKMLEK